MLSLSLIRCSDDGTSLTELHLGNRGLTGQLPADAFGQLPDLTYLMPRTIVSLDHSQRL